MELKNEAEMKGGECMKKEISRKEKGNCFNVGLLFVVCSNSAINICLLIYQQVNEIQSPGDRTAMFTMSTPQRLNRQVRTNSTIRCCCNQRCLSFV